MSDERVRAVPVDDNGEALVDLRASLRVEDRRGIGDDRFAWARADIVSRLGRAEATLPDGVHLLVIEGHRSTSEQRRIAEVYEARVLAAGPLGAPADVAATVARYVAPVEVAGHLTGGALDLTLCDDEGAELDLGSAEAASELDSDALCYFDAPVDPVARRNRDLLAEALSAQGFVNYPSEWWHWSFGDRYWAVVTGADAAVYGAVQVAGVRAGGRRLALLEQCDNTGRWGPDDQLGTLNMVTAEVRVAAARLVRSGRVVSLAKPVNTVPSAVDPRPAWHVMHLETERPYASADSLHLQIHGLANTHLDALGHMFLDGVGYNGVKQAEVVAMGGLTALDISLMRTGIVTRGVLLDAAAAAGRRWLDPSDTVDRELLEAAEAVTGVQVGAGDAVFVHVGLERREAEQGPEKPGERAGLDLGAVAWLAERDVAVYSGDCIERFPSGDELEMPLHQLGIARMGLVLLDCPSLTELVNACASEGRAEFMLMAAPLDLRGGTGSPVNPLALF